MTDSLPLLQDVAPVWVRALAVRGVDSSAALALWREDHGQPPALALVDMLERWASGDTRIVDLARERSVPHSRVQTMLTSTVLHLISPHLEDLPRWVQARAAGVEDGTAARIGDI